MSKNTLILHKEEKIVFKRSAFCFLIGLNLLSHAQANVPAGDIVTQEGAGFAISAPPEVIEFFENGKNWAKFAPKNAELAPVPLQSQKKAGHAPKRTLPMGAVRKLEATEAFTKRTVSPSIPLRIGPQTVNLYGTGGNKLHISDNGKISLLEGQGDFQPSEEAHQNSVLHSCASFQEERVFRYIRFHEYVYHPDGRKVATGGHHDEPQPEQAGDSLIRRVGNWSIC